MEPHLNPHLAAISTQHLSSFLSFPRHHFPLCLSLARQCLHLFSPSPHTAQTSLLGRKRRIVSVAFCLLTFEPVELEFASVSGWPENFQVLVDGPMRRYAMLISMCVLLVLEGSDLSDYPSPKGRTTRPGIFRHLTNRIRPRLPEPFLPGTTALVQCSPH